MPRQVRTARGEIVDFDTILIKQQLAEAPMKVDVARRKEFIDTKETKGRGAKKPLTVQPAPVEEAKPVVEVKKTSTITVPPAPAATTAKK